MSLDNEADQRVGQLVDGRYEVLAKIARGGMATVYQAYDRKLDRLVALKLMHQHLTEGEEGQDFLRRFDREARTAAQLNHKNIVRIYDQGEFEGQRYLTMEYVEGITLRELLKREKTLSVKDSLNTVIALLQALENAHSLGLVHRDIKPENVLIDRHGGVHLTDFGLSKAVAESKSTATGIILGTVAYVAPEIVDRGVVSPQADIYSLGVLMFELLTGEPPYVGKTAVQTAFMHVKKTVPNVHQLYSNIHPYVSKLIETFCSKDLQVRPENATQALQLAVQVKAALRPQDLNQKTSDWDNMNQATEVFQAPAALPLELEDADTEIVQGPQDDRYANLDHSSQLSIADSQNEPAKNANANASSNFLSDPVSQDIDAKPRHRGRNIIIALIFLVALGVGGWWWWNNEGPGAYRTFPLDLVGATQANAEHYLNEQSIVFQSLEDWSLSIPLGSVITSQPEPGSSFKYHETTLTLIVSKGVHYVKFPAEIVKKPVSEAEKILKAAGFVVTTQSKYSLEVPKDQVMDASRSTEESVIYGETITLTVSNGPEPVKMPNLLNESRSEAIAQLDRLKIKFQLTEEYSEEYAQDSVMGQSAKAEAELRQGDTVTLVISLGKPVTVPNLVGKSQANAHQALEILGLLYEDLQIGSGALGLVQSQDPPAETVVKAGTTITLNIV
ncbi:MAG: protein kinase [Bifidobacteriaceae bacterium]|jgi:serine/threonine-protein kinase|nr:protein kinase [Bifidobacteriaceae bacterium]